MIMFSSRRSLWNELSKRTITMDKLSKIFPSPIEFIEVSTIVMIIGGIVFGDVTGNQVQNSIPNEQVV